MLSSLIGFIRFLFGVSVCAGKLIVKMAGGYGDHRF
jgi:hypothetical protein